MSKKKRPNFQVQDLPYVEAASTDKQHPRFCLRYLSKSHNVSALEDKGKRADFAERLELLSQLTWGEIKMQNRHKLGFENMPVDQIRVALPDYFADASKVQIFRYSGLLPMIGIRSQDVFHVLGLAADFEDFYDHG